MRLIYSGWQTVRRPHALRALMTVAFTILLLPPGNVAFAAAYDWPQFDGNAQHSGTDTYETTITASTVATLHRLFQVALPGVADGAPAYLSAVSTLAGLRDMLFLTTRDGFLLARDAHSGAPLWSQQYGPGSCRINGSGGPCYTTSSPAIDPNRHYVYSYGLDGYVHKYQVGDGTEITGGGWPELATLKPFDEKESSALSIATAHNGMSYLYVANGGYPGDSGDYQGHVTVINLDTGAQRVFNTLCSGATVDGTPPHFVETPGTPDCPQAQSAVWARSGVVYDPDVEKIYFATGNGDYAPSNGDWGDSVLALNPDGTGANGAPLDSYTPADYQQLQNTDADLGSTAPALVPAPPGSTVQHLAVQGGKDATLRLLNLDNLSGQGGPGHTGGEVGPAIDVPQGNQVLSAPAVWVNPADRRSWVFVATYNGLAGLQVSVSGTGIPRLTPVWQVGGATTSALVANGVLYYASAGNLRALDPLTGAQLWSSTQGSAGGSIGGIHWESPTVANGIVYITDENGTLSAYAPENPSPIPPSPTSTPSTTPTATPTDTPPSTNTPIPPTATPTNTPTNTNTPVPATPTNTPASTVSRMATAGTTPTSSPTRVTVTLHPSPTATAHVTRKAAPRPHPITLRLSTAGRLYRNDTITVRFHGPAATTLTILVEMTQTGRRDVTTGTGRHRTRRHVQITRVLFRRVVHARTNRQGDAGLRVRLSVASRHVTTATLAVTVTAGHSKAHTAMHVTLEPGKRPRSRAHTRR